MTGRPATGPVGRVLLSHALASVAMSMPWPLLLVMVWRETESGTWLGVAAAARMAPYVALSWWVARLADRKRRDRLVRATLVARILLLTGVAAALAGDRPTAGVVLATLAVALATPAYPALAAGMPRLAGAASRRATDLLVTIEVASFVVGPALGGLLLGVPSLVGPASVAGAVLGWLLYAGIRQPRPESHGTTWAPGPHGTEPTSATSTGVALAVLATVNAVVAGTGVALLPLAERAWTALETGWTDASAYGLATGALGFGALGGPLLSRRGHGLARRLRHGLLVGAAALVAAALAPTAAWALAPLFLLGAAAVSIEAAATELLQDSVPDHRRAGMLGLGDSAMVLAALIASLVAPLLAGWWGPRPVLWLMAAVCCVAAPVVARAVVRRPAGRVGEQPAAVAVTTPGG